MCLLLSFAIKLIRPCFLLSFHLLLFVNERKNVYQFKDRLKENVLLIICHSLVTFAFGKARNGALIRLISAIISIYILSFIYCLHNYG